MNLPAFRTFNYAWDILWCSALGGNADGGSSATSKRGRVTYSKVRISRRCRLRRIQEVRQSCMSTLKILDSLTGALLKESK